MFASSETRFLPKGRLTFDQTGQLEDRQDDTHRDKTDDEAHDHDDHDHAGGEAHVHGLSELAVSLDGATVSISLEGALANFDLDESLRSLDDTGSSFLVYWCCTVISDSRFVL